ncbi:Dihydrolipoamide acetyltransferase [Phaffia rhodozyma]|uniref:Dihydrolipoamide acetyltransferase n=1 Tax=Phaffia rhodozyma TaxID=264483 RepID=A0A0F7SH37_PHARH|nr:Dihydrolipoamide acetyltransferase [Phaffia rhodozyma]
MLTARSFLRTLVKPAHASFSTSSVRLAASAFRFPAMSPTMTEGGIAEWKVKEGDVFSSGDILLEIETDKATIDVETTDDGVMGKILIPNGTKEIKVGTLIGILAEEGDDLSSLSADQFSESDADSASPPSTPESSSAPSSSSSSSSIEPSTSSSPSSSSSHHSASDYSHAQALLPGVHRLLLSSGLEPNVIKGLKGSGKNGTLTTGDVLVAMGKLKNVWGSVEAEKLEFDGRKGVFTRFGASAAPAASKSDVPAVKPSPPQDPLSLRQAVLQGLVTRAQPASVKAPKVTFEDLMDDYVPHGSRSQSKPAIVAEAKVTPKNEYEGLW